MLVKWQPCIEIELILGYEFWLSSTNYEWILQCANASQKPRLIQIQKYSLGIMGREFLSPLRYYSVIVS